MRTRSLPILSGLVILVLAAGCHAAQIRIAVATNFSATMKALQQDFETASNHRLKLLMGSTGKHYAQIVHGAPFDVFLAADQERPEQLESQQLTVPGSRFTYARGRLVLWRPAGSPASVGPDLLKGNAYTHLAIANPRLAPYGRAAMQTLSHLGLRLEGRLVLGEDISQAFQFVSSGNAELGLIAYSQVLSIAAPADSFWLVPEPFHSPILQQAVLLHDKPPARAFLDYLRSPAARAIIRRFGYDTPD